MICQHLNNHDASYSPAKKVKEHYCKGGLTPSLIALFHKIIYSYYHRHGRTFPWRKTYNPYHILISEIMLQQTSTQRVLEKYDAFITCYPDLSTLSIASLPDILAHWQGLGYNRRALFLKKIAGIITTDLHGVFPRDEKTLQTLPGIGPYTAAAICAFAFNQPTILLETNIQSVYIYFFCDGQQKVRDQDLRPLVWQTLDIRNPRQWYYALMDYGVMIKKTQDNPSRKSARYAKQSPFKNSNRQLRGLILRVLLKEHTVTLHHLCHQVQNSPDHLLPLIIQLEMEGFIQRDGNTIRLVR